MTTGIHLHWVFLGEVGSRLGIFDDRSGLAACQERPGFYKQGRHPAFCIHRTLVCKAGAPQTRGAAALQGAPRHPKVSGTGTRVRKGIGCFRCSGPLHVRLLEASQAQSTSGTEEKPAKKEEKVGTSRPSGPSGPEDQKDVQMGERSEGVLKLTGDPREEILKFCHEIAK